MKEFENESKELATAANRCFAFAEVKEHFGGLSVLGICQVWRAKLPITVLLVAN